MAVYDDQKTGKKDFDEVLTPDDQADIERTARDNATFDDMMRREGLYNPRGDGSEGSGGNDVEGGDKKSQKKLSPEELGDAESSAGGGNSLSKAAGNAVAAGLSSVSPAGKFLALVRPNNKRKKAGLAGFLASIVIFIVGIVGGPALGPLEWVNLAQNLQLFHFSDQSQLSNSRSAKFMKWMYYKHDYSKTRLGIVANLQADKIQTAMEKNGFKMNIDTRTGFFGGFKFDPKTAAQGPYAGLENANEATIKSQLATDLKIDVGKITVTNGVYDIPSSTFNRLSNGRIIGRIYGTTTDRGKVWSALMKRLLIKKVGLSWNPLTSLESKALQKGVDKFTSIREERSKKLTGTEPTTDVTAQGTSDKNGKPDPTSTDAATGGNGIANEAKTGKLTTGALPKGLSGAAAVVGFLCIAKTLADNAGVANRINDYKSALAVSNEILSLASKIQDGGLTGSNTNAINDAVIGVYSQSLFSDKTGSAMNANSIHAELGSPTAGITLPANLDPSAQNTTVSQLLSKIPGLGPVCAVLNNSIVSIITTVAGGPISIVAGGFFATAPGQALFGQLQSLFIKGIPDLSQPQYAGAVFGEMGNLGTRLMANESAMSVGGRVLSDGEEGSLNQTTVAQLRESTASQSYADRYLNPHVSTSLASHLIGSVNPNSPMSSFASVVSSLTASLPGQLVHLISPRAFAANTQPKSKVYYGVPKVGFTQAANDADQNPEQNADQASDILTGADGQKYQDLLKKCNNIVATFDNNTLDFAPGTGITTSYDTGIPADCKNDNDPNFVIIRNAVYDTFNAESIACIDYNDSASCNAINYNPSTPAPPTPSGTWTNVVNDQFDGTTLPAHWKPYDSRYPKPSGGNCVNPAHSTVSGGYLHLLMKWDNSGTNTSVGCTGYQWYTGAVSLSDPQFEAQNEQITLRWRVVRTPESAAPGFVGAAHVIPERYPVPDSLWPNNEEDWCEGLSLSFCGSNFHYNSGSATNTVNSQIQAKETVDLTQWHTMRMQRDGQVYTMWIDDLTNPVVSSTNPTNFFPKTMSATEAAANIGRVILQQDCNYSQGCPTAVSARTGTEDIQVDWITVDTKTTAGGISAQGWVWPIHKEDLGNPAAGLTQCWLPYYAGKGYHAAIDIGVSYKPVFAAHAGTVVTKANDGYATFIIDTGVDPADSSRHLFAVYEHMSAITVNVGDTVTAGQPIGTSGAVGAPGGPHLHFGISDSLSHFGVYPDPWHTANPLDYLPADYSPGLETTGSESCKTADILHNPNYGFSLYKTLGTFNAYK